LEQWLKHSLKDTCELCSAKYLFDSEYSADAPEVIPLHVLVISGVKKLLLEVVPFVIRVFLAAALWLGVAPLCTSWMYKVWFRPHTLMSFSTRAIFHRDVVLKDTMTGLVLMGVIAVSFIVLMSFADFLRFNWMQEIPPGGGVGEHNNNNNNNNMDENDLRGAVGGHPPPGMAAMPRGAGGVVGPFAAPRGALHVMQAARAARLARAAARAPAANDDDDDEDDDNDVPRDRDRDYGGDRGIERTWFDAGPHSPGDERPLPGGATSATAAGAAAPSADTVPAPPALRKVKIKAKVRAGSSSNAGGGGGGGGGGGTGDGNVDEPAEEVGGKTAGLGPDELRPMQRAMYPRRRPKAEHPVRREEEGEEESAAQQPAVPVVPVGGKRKRNGTPERPHTTRVVQGAGAPQQGAAAGPRGANRRRNGGDDGDGERADVSIIPNGRSRAHLYLFSAHPPPVSRVPCPVPSPSLYVRGASSVPRSPPSPPPRPYMTVTMRTTTTMTTTTTTTTKLTLTRISRWTWTPPTSPT